MKIFKKISLPRSLIYFLLIFLSSCMATPQIHIKSAGMSMEIEKSAFKVISAVCSPDGRYIAAGYQDGTVRVWDVLPGKMLKSIYVDSDAARFTLMATSGAASLGVLTVNFSPDGKYLITGSLVGYVKIWEVETGKEYIDLESKLLSGFGIKGAAIIYDRKRIYGIAKKGLWLPSAPITIRVWDLVSGKKIKDISISDTSSPLTSFFSTDGKYVLIKTELAIKYLDIDSEKEVWSKNVERSDFDPRSFSDYFRFNNVVAISSDKRYVLSGGKATLKLRDAMSSREIKSFEGHTAEIHSVAFSPDGKLAVSGSADGTVRAWDLESDKEIKKLENYSGEVRSVAISPNGRYVVSTGPIPNHCATMN